MDSFANFEAISNKKKTTKKSSINRYKCKVCNELMVEPVSLPNCEHLFCLACFKHRIELKKRCLKCKSDISQIPRSTHIDICRKTQDTIAEKFPEEFRRRKHELIKADMWIGNKLPIKFVYGNYHKILESSSNGKYAHEYTLFAEMNQNEELTEKFIKSVDFVLKIPKLNIPVYSIKEYPFNYKNKTPWEL